MRLQGNLQLVFDALYHMGVIDPVLEMDWQSEVGESDDYQGRVHAALQIANQFQGNFDILLEELGKLDERTLSFLAMEVAREYADFHARKYVH